MKVGSKQSALIAAVAAASPFLFHVTTAQAQNVSNSTWLPAGSGSWTVTPATTWDSDPSSDPDTVPNYPNGADSSATFVNTGATRTTTLDAPITIGALTITNNGTGMQVIAGTVTNNLTFDVTTGNATINVSGTSTTQNRLNTPMVFNDTVVVNVVGNPTGTAGHFLFGGVITGTGGFTKTGSGRMTLANTPSTVGQFKDYTGPTVFNDGRVRVSLDGLPRLTSSFTIENKGQFTPIASGNFSPGGGTAVLSIAGTGPTDGPDAPFEGAILPDANLDIVFNNPILLPGGEALIHSRKALAAITGSITFTNKITGAGILALTAPAGDNQLGRYVIQSNANDYTGGTVIWGGAVDATVGKLGADTAPLSVNVLDAPGATTNVQLNTSSPTTVGSLSGTRLGSAAGSTIDNGGQLFTVNQTTAGSYDGVIFGSGGFTLGSLSTNTLTLTGSNTYAGNTTINAGRLHVTKTAALPGYSNPGRVNVNSGGTLGVSAGGAGEWTSGDIDGLTGGAVFNPGSTLAVDTTNATGPVNHGSFTGAYGVTKLGPGTLAVNQVKVGGAVTVSGGALSIPTNGTPSGMLETTGVSVATGATLQMNDNDMIVNYTGTSPEFALRDKVLLYRNGPAAEGIGFTETVAEDTILAFGETSELAITSFQGVTVDNTTVVGKYTYYGDGNLDGQVTTDDYVAVDLGLGTGDSWVQGDFDLNGVVTTDDYVVVDLNLGKGTGTPLAYAEEQARMIALHTEMFGQSYVEKLAYASEFGWVAASVPEPGALSLVGLAAAGLLGRRRRQA